MDCGVVQESATERRSKSDSKAAVALLMSGGIGDYLHYLCRLDAFLSGMGLGPHDVTIFVESTVPNQVDSLFALALPEFRRLFVPAQLNWTKTNPLLAVNRIQDRLNRPAYRYVVSQGYRKIIDWFLPFILPQDIPISIDRVARLLVEEDVNPGPDLVVSLRDKGALWWPSEPLCKALEHLVGSDGEIVFVGTDVERPDWQPGMITMSNVLAALRLAARARLFVGTDTGLATVREFVGRPNVYCVTKYWYEKLMIRYGYISSAMLDASGSVVVTSGVEMLDHVALLLGHDHRKPGDAIRDINAEAV
jgi:hypothetical protein